MCGIAGIFSYHHAASRVNRDELRQIRDYMILRGPDGYGEWFDEHHRIGLGHRRLAIIDLSERGAQPMVSDDQQLVVSFNGEIYNYRELRKSLESKGCVFRTDSDTEVLLHLYAEKGVAMLNDLRGMFAFALWDANKHALLMARDPYGIKPLYYADDGWTIRLASQVKSLLTSLKVSQVSEPAGIVGFYLFGSVPEPYTLYQEIRAVPAGSYVWVDEAGPRTPVEYYSIANVWAEAEKGQPISSKDTVVAVSEALRDSVRHHMVADVPVGAFLSAGIDSGALLGLMTDVATSHRDNTKGALRADSKTQAVTLTFDEFFGTENDEAPLAASVAKHYGADHTVRTVDEQEFHSDLPKLLAAMDQPSIDGVNTWFVSKAVHEAGLKVAVSGVGGDELFGGYPSFRDLPKWVSALWLPAHIPGLGVIAEQVQAAFAPLFPQLHPKAAGMLRYGGNYAGAYLLRRGLFLPCELPLIVGEELAREGMRRLRPLQLIQTCLGRRALKRSHGIVASFESSLYMRNQLLRDTDWASMAHSLEVRVPLVDVRLLEAVAPILANGKQLNHKALMANSLENKLPDNVANRPKTGFVTPVARWQRSYPQAGLSQSKIRNASGPWARSWSLAVMDRMQSELFDFTST